MKSLWRERSKSWSICLDNKTSSSSRTLMKTKTMYTWWRNFVAVKAYPTRWPVFRSIMTGSIYKFNIKLIVSGLVVMLLLKYYKDITGKKLIYGVQGLFCRSYYGANLPLWLMLYEIQHAPTDLGSHPWPCISSTAIELSRRSLSSETTVAKVLDILEHGQRSFW